MLYLIGLNLYYVDLYKSLIARITQQGITLSQQKINGAVSAKELPIVI